MSKNLKTMLVVALIIGFGLSWFSKSINSYDTVSVYLCGPGTEEAKQVSVERERPAKGFPVAYEFSELSANLCVEKGKSYPMGFSPIQFALNTTFWVVVSLLGIVVISKVFGKPSSGKSSKASANARGRKSQKSKVVRRRKR